MSHCVPRDVVARMLALLLAQMLVLTGLAGGFLRGVFSTERSNH
jgi:hypothetical protein